jgi:hypothetical protein
MKTWIKNLSALIILFSCSLNFGQIKNYQYKRLISGTMDSWNRIIIPNEMYSKLNPDLSDIRIIGITKDGDTIEAPYLLEEMSEKSMQSQVAFKTLNITSQDNNYYYTFEVPSLEVVNEIVLSFNEVNYDRIVRLEGSNEQSGWFVILDNYRILSINNKFANYSYSTLYFHESKYRFYRLSFESDSKPELLRASISLLKNIPGTYRNYELKNTGVVNDPVSHETIITGDLPDKVPVSYLKIDISDKYDYYRRISVQYLTDSSESPKGWIYNYSTVATDMLSSLEPNEFTFPNRFMRQLKITISNYDNEPLTLDKLSVKGNLYQLIVRIVKPASYYLVYSNEKAQKPIYDIENFREKIPDALTNLTIGSEETINQAPSLGVKPLFTNKRWLWIIMAIIILLLGGFTYKMIKN